MNSNRIITLAAAFCAAATMAARADQDITTKTFPVKPGGRLIVNVDRGSIHIATSESDKVNVKVTRELKDASAAETKHVLGQHKIEMTSADNEVRIEASGPKQFSGFHPLNRLQVDYTIAIPAKFDVDLRTAGGHIEVADLEGKAELHTSGGNLDIATIKGSLKAHTSGGHIAIEKVVGDANIDTSGGNVRAGTIDGNLVAHTSGGHITLDKTTGTVKASTSGGNIEIKEALGPVNARTSGGHVTARLNGQPKEDCSLKTSGGNVDVVLLPKLSFNLDAHTGGGRVTSDFPGDFNKEKTRLTAQINGGGPELTLETSGGHISVRRE